MPYKSTLEDQVLFTKWWGSITISEQIQMQQQWHASPDFDRIRYSIHDYSECDHIAYSQSEVWYSAAIDGAAGYSNPQIEIAIVGANAELLEAAKAYTNSELSRYPLHIFSCMDEARAWVTKAQMAALRANNSCR